MKKFRCVGIRFQKILQMWSNNYTIPNMSSRIDDVAKDLITDNNEAFTKLIKSKGKVDKTGLVISSLVISATLF